MAERDPHVPQSIQSLLYVERNGNYCGYKPELISDGISSDWETFLICSECEGISRRPIQVYGNTLCEMCVTGKGRNIDERIGNKVVSLKSVCPLSENGCEWTAVLGEIEQHMEVCQRMLVECQLKCGGVFERADTEQHNKETCPLRMIDCQYCEHQIQVKEENQHIGVCTNHPDTEVPCPYKELGCDVIMLRKEKDIHLTDSIIGHQKLMLDQLNLLRERNKQLERLKEQQKNKNQEQETLNEIHKIMYQEQETQNEQQDIRHQEQDKLNDEQKSTNQEQERVNQRQETLNDLQLSRIQSIEQENNRIKLALVSTVFGIGAVFLTGIIAGIGTGIGAGVIVAIAVVTYSRYST